jgi:hypothetical protein
VGVFTELVVTFKPGTTYGAAREAIEPVPGWHAADHASTLGSAATLYFFDGDKAFAALQQLEKAPAVAGVVSRVPAPTKPRTRTGKVVRK